MSESLLKEKDRLERWIKKYEETVQLIYQDKNEMYMADYSHLTERITELKRIVEELDFGPNWEEEVRLNLKDGWSCNTYYELKELIKLEEEYDKIWGNRPFKGEIPEEEYEDESYLEIKSRLRKIEMDLKLLANPGRIDYGKKYRELYDEYSGLVREVVGNEEYKRVFSENEPRDVDLSKGKLSNELSDKIVRIKELWEKKERYEEMDRHNMDNQEIIGIGGGMGGFVSGIQTPSPVHVVDTSDKLSVLRRYNQGVSNEFIKKNIEILQGNYTVEEFGREIDESVERRKREGDSCREALNASWNRINEFDRKFKEREAFKDRVLKWFLSTLLTVLGVRIGWELLKIYVFYPSSGVNNVPSFNRAWNLEKRGFFVDVMRN